MFKDANIFTSFSVDNLEKAKDFYGKLLGLSVSDAAGMENILKIRLTNNHEIIVYYKPNHIPATFTILNIPVDNVEQTVEKLTGAGVKFEIYNDANIKTDSKGIFHGSGPKIAWFKDPAGNILSVLEDKQ
jgi:predicted enzyme related to lactoylglutathione lyase